jgi:hypothetical protein
MVATLAVGVTMMMAVAAPAIVVVHMLNTALIPNQHIVIAPAVVVPMRNPLAILIMEASHQLAQDHP